MSKTRFLGCFLGVVAGAVLSFSPAHGDEGPASLAEIHKTLLQAAGDQADTPPPSDEQIRLLHSALKMLREIPHVYHGQLKSAAQLINAALDDLSSGASANKARTDILEADDLIKSVM